jgi:hypothetical protein
VAAMVELVRSLRGSLAGFDVALNVEPGEDGRRQRDLGATWVMHAFGASATVAEVLAVVERGCPS